MSGTFVHGVFMRLRLRQENFLMGWSAHQEIHLDKTGCAQTHPRVHAYLATSSDGLCQLYAAINEQDDQQWAGLWSQHGVQKWVAFLCLAPCGGWRVGFAWGAKRGGVFFLGLPSGAEEDEACPSMCAKTFNEPKTRGQTPFRREAWLQC